jgi:hypothetical protein
MILSWAQRELGLMGHVCLVVMMVGDAGLDHRKLPREDQTGIESADSNKLPRDGVRRSRVHQSQARLAIRISRVSFLMDELVFCLPEKKRMSIYARSPFLATLPPYLAT